MRAKGYPVAMFPDVEGRLLINEDKVECPFFKALRIQRHSTVIDDGKSRASAGCKPHLGPVRIYLPICAGFQHGLPTITNPRVRIRTWLIGSQVGQWIVRQVDKR